VRLCQERDEPSASSSGSPGGRELALRDTSGPPLLDADKVAAIEAYMKKAGGSEQATRLETLFGVRKHQLARHFSLYEDRRRIYAAPLSDAEKAAVAKAAASSLARGSELRGLEQRLEKLTVRRGSVAEAMVFCIDHGAQQAAALSRRLIKALEEPDLRTDTALARLFLVSDILFNANSGAKGAAGYRTSLQDLLPNACERFGRQWLQGLQGRLEQDRARAAVSAVLEAWRSWAVFPPLYTKGLEALLFAPVPRADEEEEAREEPGQGDSEALRRRLRRWTLPAARLPFAARLRGLSGAALAASVCRVRLCHYERFWDARGLPDECDLPEESLDGAPVEPLSSAVRSVLLLPRPDAELDGESCSDGELAAAADEERLAAEAVDARHHGASLGSNGELPQPDDSAPEDDFPDGSPLQTDPYCAFEAGGEEEEEREQPPSIESEPPKKRARSRTPSL